MNTESALIEEVLSPAETMILMALEASDAVEPSRIPLLRRKATKDTVIHTDELLHFNPMAPKSQFTMQLTGDTDSREYTLIPEGLITHPKEILGETTEMVSFDEGTFNWSGLRRRKKLPKHVVCLGKPDAIYEHHYRCVIPGMKPIYQHLLAIFDAKGEQIPSFIRGMQVGYGMRKPMYIGMASVIEDAHRSGTMLATVSDSLELKFPVPLDAYKDIFSIRDAPLTPTGRKKAILHWVNKHTRSLPKDKTVSVKGHERGIDEFDIGGFHIALQQQRWK